MMGLSDAQAGFGPATGGGLSDAQAGFGPAKAPASTQPPATDKLGLTHLHSFWHNFWSNLTNESIGHLASTDLRSLEHGMQAFMNAEFAGESGWQQAQQQVDHFKNKPVPQGFKHASAADLVQYPQNVKWMNGVPVVKKSPLSGVTATQLTKLAVKQMAANPGATMADVLKSIVAHPEFLLLAGTGTGEAGILANVAGVASKAAGGAAINAGLEALHQYGTGKFSPAAVGAQALQGGMFATLLGVKDLGKIIPEGERTAGHVSEETAAEILKQYTEDTGNPDHLTLADVKEKTDAELNAEAKAYHLMKSGASRKEVLRIRKKNPLIGKKLDEMMARRQEIRQGPMKYTLQGEHLGPEGGEPGAGTPSLEEGPKGTPPVLPQDTSEPPSTTPLEKPRRLPGPDQIQPDMAPTEEITLPSDRIYTTKMKPSEILKYSEQDNALHMNAEKFSDLVKDIQKNGVKNKPILYRDQAGKLHLHDGNHRALAAQVLGDEPMDVEIVDRSHQGGPAQAGKADPRLLTHIALTLGGATTAAALAKKDKLEAAIAGGMSGLAISLLPEYIDHMRENWKRTLGLTATTAGAIAVGTKLDKQHPVEGALLGSMFGASKLIPEAQIPKIGDMTIDDFVNLRNGTVAAEDRRIAQVVNAVKVAVPDAARREQIALALDKGNLRGLSGHELQAAKAFQTFMKSYGEAAKNEGVIQDLVGNYVTHIVEQEGLPKSKVQEVMQHLFGESQMGGAGISPKSKFGLHRKYATFAELEKALEGTGLRVKTKDIADILQAYGKSMNRAIANKRLLDNLQLAKEGDVPGANPLIVEDKKAPPGYEYINSPQMRGMRAHPDIAPSLRFVMENYQPSYPMRAALSLSLAQKRLATGLSLFHGANLVNAWAGAGLKGSIRAALDSYYKGGLGDSVDYGIRNGLKVDTLPMETDVQALQKMGALFDGLVNKAFGSDQHLGEKGLGAIEKIQRNTFDRLTWDYLYTGIKLAVFNREFEQGLMKHPEMDPNEIARQVASYTNDTFGGLDWYRVATETQSQWGRRMGLAMLSPRGRAKLQLGLFAPDWTMSTFRSLYKAIPFSTDMKLTSRLHQKYVARTALMYLTLMNGINMATSGHPIWDNRDPTKLEWRDGTTQQMAKHAMEGPEWLRSPRQMFLNKLSPILKEPFEQALGVQYLSASGKSPPIKSRIGHALSLMAPIPLQSGEQAPNVGNALARAVVSTLGAPIYGETSGQRFQKKLESDIKRMIHPRKKKLGY